jgi:hypothetical protein
MGDTPDLVGETGICFSYALPAGTPHRHCLHSKLLMSGVPLWSTVVQ